MLTDAHVHLSLFSDVKEQLACARQNGIRLISVSTDLTDSENSLRLASVLDYPVCIGIHPWFAKATDASLHEESFLKLAVSPLTVGIGECGLDSAIELPLPAQERLLRVQLNVAAKLNKPVNLHIRKCHGDLLRVLSSYKGRLCGLVHNFSFSEDLARSYLNYGLFLSVGHHLQQQSAKMVRVLKYAGLDHLLLETDLDGRDHTPYDAALLKDDYRILSEIFSLSQSEVERKLEHNLVQSQFVTE